MYACVFRKYDRELEWWRGDGREQGVSNRESSKGGRVPAEREPQFD
jgi:hypothetical protein